MKKIYILLCMMVITIAMAMTVSAGAYEDFYYVGFNGYLTIYGYSHASGDIVIPSVIDGCPVVSIGDNAFKDCTEITSVTIPYGVTSIGEGAFYGCTNLISANIPDSVTSIDSYAFAYCPKLLNVTIPNTVTYIGGWAFVGCKNFTSVTIPDKVTFIGYDSFGGCTNLTEITLPFIGVSNDGTGKTHFGHIFGASSPSDNSKYVPSSLKSVTITSGTSLTSFAFTGCCSLTNVSIPASVTSIGSQVFSGCGNLKGIMVNENNAKYCNDEVGALYNKSKTELISFPGGKKTDLYIIPNTVITIYKGAFSGCTELNSVSIPNSVTTIDSYVFYDCDRFTSLTIPNSVTSIGSYAFGNCDKLTSVSIPDSVTSIGSYAFYNCISLTSLIIPGSVMTISEGAFKGCSNLVEITLPFVGRHKTVDKSSKDLSDSVFGYIFGYTTSSSSNKIEGATYQYYRTYISNNRTRYQYYHYYIPSSLKKVTITSSAEEIPSDAFYNCENLTSITIPASITYIGDFAFWYCTSLTNITIPDSVAYIGFKAFYNTKHYNTSSNWEDDVLYIGNHLIDCNTSKSGSYSIKQGTKTIASDAFYECTSLTSITIPDSVSYIGDYNFYNCTSLTSITIPDSVTYIDDAAFCNCKSLTSITIPDSVTYIGESAFYGCNNLTEITLPFVGETKDGTSNTHFGYIFGASSYSYNYAEVPNSLKKVTITGGSSISKSAFYGCNSLAEITLPFVGNTKDGTTNTHFGYIFGASSYSYNDDYVPSGLKKVTITGGSIGSNAFYNCDNITNLNILGGVESIGSAAFAHCYGLTDVSMSEGVATIGESAFYDCTGLTSISIPDSVTSIGNTAFKNCIGLTDVTLSKGITSIGLEAFYGCECITSINIPDSVLTIDRCAFNGCDNLESITIPDSVTSIGDYAFSGCSKLEAITIPKGITEINQGTFNDCSSLTSIDIPDNVTVIGQRAFNNCKNVTSLIIGSGVTTIEKEGFANLEKITTIVVPDNITYIGNYAFSGCNSLKELTIPFVGETMDGDTNTNFGYIFSSYDGYNVDQVPNSLEKVVVTGGTRVADSAFESCFSIKSIILPETITVIEREAFYECEALAEINIPEAVKKIGNNIFGCTAIYNDSDNWEDGVLYFDNNLVGTEYTISGEYAIKDGTRVIADSAFKLCKMITKIVVPESVIYVGSNAMNCQKINYVFFKGDAPEIGTTVFPDRQDFAIVHSLTSSGFTTPTWNGYKCHPDVELGDVSGDGVTDLKDVTTLRRYLAGGYNVTVIEVALDVNEDGAVDLKDITYLRRALAGGYGIELK